MAWTIPGYISRSVDPSAPIGFEWNDEEPESHFVHDDARLAQQIGVSTGRGIAALSIGCTEWIVYRFSTLSSDPMPSRYLEAAWAGLMNWDFMLLKHGNALRDWKGPIRRPLFVAIRTLAENLSMVKKGDFPAEETVHLTYLARYVLPDPKPFMKWLGFALERLQWHYAGDSLGAPVPREALDPDFDFKPEQAPELLNRYRRGLSPADNPYLHLPPAP